MSDNDTCNSGNIGDFSCFRPAKWAEDRLCVLCALSGCPTKRRLLYETIQIDLPYHFKQNSDTIGNCPTPESLREEAERAGVIYPENSDCIDWEKLLTELTKEEGE